MKIEKVTFQTTYNIGPFLNVKVGFEAIPEGNPGDAPYDMLTMLKEMADEWHRKEYPHLYQDGVNAVSVWDANYKPPPSTLTTTSSSVIDYKAKEQLEIAIDNATTLEELAPLKEAIWKAGLTTQYMNKVKQLSNG